MSFRARINRIRRQLWRALFGRMLFGERSAGGLLRPATRLSPTVLIEHEDRLQLADDVFIGHFVFIEASAGVRVDTGVQITNFVSVVSHSTHRSVRVAKALSGVDWQAATPSNSPGKAATATPSAGLPEDAQVAGLPGDVRAPIVIGAHSFIGPHSTLEAGTQLGLCCLVAAHSRVRGTVPDFAVLAGSPARVVGDVREGDHTWLLRLAATHGLGGEALAGAYARWVQGVRAAQAKQATSPAAAAQAASNVQKGME
jgi:acetyltransferase-like isoleucine patch superfamily enzyme